MAIWYINLLVIWYIFSRFGKFYREKSGNPGERLQTGQRISFSSKDPLSGEPWPYFSIRRRKSVLHKINLQHEKGEEKKVRDNRGQFDEPMFDQ
jgi:hypothetical protein